jgi:hypothetical protein
MEDGPYQRTQSVKVSFMKMAVFWDVKSCSLVETDRRFRDANCLDHESDEN